MENVVLVIHLLLALALIGTVLLQRSEGGGLGIGGGGGGGGLMSGRAAATALTKLTWILAVAFLVTSLTLTIFSARNANTGSVIDRVEVTEGDDNLAPPAPAGLEGSLLPPSADDAPATPPAAD
ncbi:preprotein translocase subunit SecG [Oceanomicrobium pacificus]|uniref:Protein-export membrane protein SecG n=1 Tax=Oceanomicrobium pacificus TaxID=2692916 RepID=A0A6B0TWV2_9RHOB|nr:preprotein translocase subunit SecG [Oceanomicrobium pacificus]MXU65978.1 preprotein translocase subunit SecG [Oceanomicrobium pacificus]